MGFKDLDANKLDDDLLEGVSGGKKAAGDLVNRKSTKKKFNNTLYSGQSYQAGNLLYQEDSNGKKTTTTIDGIEFNDDARLC